MSRTPKIVDWLRAAGEPTRLRLLVLCAERDLSVSDLALAVGQSEPRVSRHLRILCEAGLLARLRQGQWVHYRLTSDDEALVFLRGLLAQVDTSEPFFAKDRERLQAAAARARESSVAESRLGRALRSFVESGRPAVTVSSALVVGVDHLDLLRAATAMASRTAALAHSRRAAQAARTFLEREGLSCRVLQASNGDALSAKDVARCEPPFEVIVLDRFAASGGALKAMLDVSRGALTTSGRLWLFERYEALENSRDVVVEHPIARVRRLLREAGFSCERLSPIEADGEHVLAALAVPAALTAAGAA